MVFGLASNIELPCQLKISAGDAHADKNEHQHHEREASMRARTRLFAGVAAEISAVTQAIIDGHAHTNCFWGICYGLDDIKQSAPHTD